MKLPTLWKNVIVLALVFLAGGVAGGLFAHHRISRALAEAFDFDQWPDRGTKMLTSRLKLTPEQQPKIHATQEVVASRLKEEFRQTLVEVGRVIVDAGRAVDRELTPDQRKIHDEMKREVREAFKQHFDITLPED